MYTKDYYEIQNSYLADGNRGILQMAVKKLFTDSDI